MHKIREHKRQTRVNFRLPVCHFFCSRDMPLKRKKKQFLWFLMNSLSSAYSNHLKFVRQCVWPQYIGQFRILLLILLWFLSFAPKWLIFCFHAITLVSQMLCDFYTMYFITIHKPSWKLLLSLLWFKSYAPVTLTGISGIRVMWTHFSFFLI